jgi:hypothetical protein
LDGNKLGLEVDKELGSFRFFIYKKVKKHRLMQSGWVRNGADQSELYKTLAKMIKRYYKLMERLGDDGNLPIYTEIELKKLISHLHYHQNAGTLSKILEKEVIYN